ncbi:serine/threonine-protein kinase 36 isoform X2 [Denticeps clupeoides]|uniref:serine/threonine-protein kinase 36 isoform X2 n=1 Tax=Denticeps clupeoides TaxID=299321 RepID=UPI0010A3FCE6|nr:serine/threonine-protein kinase 36 isoform X2 [Denticeps clupeoides]
MDQYHVLDMIGEGSFGRVYKGRKKYSGQVVALKFIQKVGRTEKELRSLKSEIDIMRRLQHPNIVLLLDSFETQREVVAVTEYAEGELFQILQDDGSLPERQVREIACQLVSALYYLHSHRILHRDMKPQNVLLGKGGVVKLCDFGFARAMSVSTLVLTSIKGTPLYMSPELVEEKPYDHTADLWSLGCILYELHTGVPPFYTNSMIQLIQLIVRDPIKWPDTMSPDCTSFLKGLLTKDPQKRLSWPDLLQHPFVADGVVVLPDEKSISPLAVSHGPDVQAHKAAARTAPGSGQSRLPRRVIGQGNQARRAGQDETDRARSKTAPPGQVPDKEASPTSSCVPRPTRVQSAPNKGQISRDYEREFPSVEVGPRQLLRFPGRTTANLGSVGMNSEESDSEEEVQKSNCVTGRGNELVEPLCLLKTKLLTSKFQGLDGACISLVQQCQQVLNGLKLSVPLGTARINEDVDLPDLLLDLVGVALSSPPVVQKPQMETLLGDAMFVLLLCWQSHHNWEVGGKSLENHARRFVGLLLRSDPNPLAPLAAAVLTLFTHRGVPVQVGTDALAATLEGFLTDSGESHHHPLPSNWGSADGLISLLRYTLTESDSSSLSWLFDSGLWRRLWVEVGSSLTKPDFLSVNGRFVLLSLALVVFGREPLACVPLLSDSDGQCVRVLAQLLTADCDGMIDSSLFWGDAASNSLSVMSCHLLSFPFTLQLPPATTAPIFTSYHSAGVIKALLQVVQSLSVSMLELPLLLLSHLLLCDPERSVSRFISAAWTSGFFSHQTAEDGAECHAPDGRRSRSRGSGDALKVTLDLLVDSLDDLRDSLEDHSGHLDKLVASLEQSELLRPNPVKLWRTTESHPRASEVRGHALEHGVRTVNSLLSLFLKSSSLSGCAVQLLALLSQTARCSSQPSLALVPLDPALLRLSLHHSEDGLRAASCRLLGTLRPRVEVEGEEAFLQDLVGRLADPAPSVRRSASRAAASWLALISRGGVAGVWAGPARGAASPLASSLRDPDALIRERCCNALGSVAGLAGGDAALLEADAPRLLQHVARADSQHAVRQAAAGALRAFGRHETLRQVLNRLQCDGRPGPGGVDPPAAPRHPKRGDPLN